MSIKVVCNGYLLMERRVKQLEEGNRNMMVSAVVCFQPHYSIIWDLLFIFGVILLGSVKVNPAQQTRLALELVTECNHREGATQTDSLYPPGGTTIFIELGVYVVECSCLKASFYLGSGFGFHRMFSDTHNIYHNVEDKVQKLSFSSYINDTQDMKDTLDIFFRTNYIEYMKKQKLEPLWFVSLISHSDTVDTADSYSGDDDYVSLNVTSKAVHWSNFSPPHQLKRQKKKKCDHQEYVKEGYLFWCFTKASSQKKWKCHLTTINRDFNGTKNIASIGFSQLVSSNFRLLPPFQRGTKSTT
ncbi:hypothetical protein K501DRAFT_335668 [Backusella circina FSU 941]|nr:hypothetical protein K501DRAFT_335668 [Backusella circina FSU 941]